MTNGDQNAWLLNELAGAIWQLQTSVTADQLPKLYLFDSLNRTMCGRDIIWTQAYATRFLGRKPAAKRFPGHYRPRGRALYGLKIA